MKTKLTTNANNYIKVIDAEKRPLKERFETICAEYVKLFEAKQELLDGYWIGEEIGGLLDYEGIYTFNFSDVRFDIDNNCPAGLITSWQDFETENYDHKKNERKYSINYENYYKLSKDYSSIKELNEGIIKMGKDAEKLRKTKKYKQQSKERMDKLLAEFEEKLKEYETN